MTLQINKFYFIIYFINSINKVRLIVLLISFINISVFSQSKLNWKLKLNEDKNKILVAAHRGDWKNFPENSIEGVKSCIDRGVDIIEIDVHKTKDGHFILMHDESVRRTTNGRKRVSKYLLKDIINLHLKNMNGEITNYTVPTLESVLLVAKDKVIINIDKSAGYFNELLKIIDELNCGSNVILKGIGPANFFYNLSKIDTTETLFIPILNGRRNDIDTFAMKSEAPLIEVLIKSDTEFVCKRDVLDRIKNYKCKIWFNALFNSISGGHAERDGALDSWNWFIEHDAKVIQTDYPFELIQYLSDLNLHEIPKGFEKVSLSNLPLKKSEVLKDSSIIKNILDYSDSIPINFKGTQNKIKNEKSKEILKKKNTKLVKYYLVKKKDTIDKILLKNNISLKRFISLNPKINPKKKPKTGMKIRIK